MQLKCPRCASTHSVGRGIRTFECACGAKLRVPGATDVPVSVGAKSKKRKAASNGKKAVEKRKPAPAESRVFRPAATNAPASDQPPRPPQPMRAKQPGPVEDVPSKGTRSSNPLDELPPFQLKPRNDSVSQLQDWDPDSVQISQSQIMVENAKFFGRTMMPYAIAVVLLVCGFIFREPLEQQLRRVHGKLVKEMRASGDPEMETLETDQSVVDELTDDPGIIPTAVSNSSAAEDGPETPIDPDKISSDAAGRAIQANVMIAVEGVGSGAGIICDRVGDQALVLTNRSLIDDAFWVAGEKSNLSELPIVELEYSNSKTAMGEVVWVAEGDTDLAIVRAPCPSSDLAAVKYEAQEIAIGDTVFFISSPGELTEFVAKTIVVDVVPGSGSGAVPTVTVDAKQLKVGSGLYNAAGALIAVSGSGEVLPDVPARAVPVSALKDVKLLSLLDDEATSLTIPQ